MGDTTKIVILGGGYAGVEAAKLLNKQYKKNQNVSITLIDKNPYHTLMTELHEIAGSRTEPEAVQVSFKRIFSGTKVNVVIDEIEAIDFPDNKLKSKVAEYPYDYLVLSTGGHPEFFGIDGIQANSFTLWSLEDAIRIREHVELMFRAAAKEPHENHRRKQLTFVVAGAGFTGIELVGELMERADTLCRKYHIDRDEVKIMVVEAQDRVLPILSEKPQRKAKEYMEKNGVEILLNAPIVKGESNGAYTLKDGRVIETDTFVWTCGIQGSEFTAKIDLTKGRKSNDNCSIATPEGIHGMSGCHFDEDERDIVGERGRILVSGEMQSVDYKNVYLAGDMIWYLHQEKVVAQIVENALQTAEVAVHNIVAEIEEKKEKKIYVPNYHGFMVSIGGRYGVASVMGMNLYGFFAMALKHFINLHYLWGLAGFNACWNYLQEEFFQIKNKRSILGGHVAAKVPAYWVLPARLWLGLMWVIEGANKIGEGWLRGDRSRSGWMFSSKTLQRGMPGYGESEVAQVVSAATDAAWTDVGTAASGTVVEPIADAVTAATDSVTDAAYVAADAVAAASEWVEESVPVAGEVLKKYWDLDASIFQWDSALVTWFRTTFMDNLAAHLHFSLFQWSIVLVEIALGLALMGGLFTWGAAVATIGMTVVFTLSGMFTWNQLWFVFLAIVMMGGAGHVAGLDHWVMPWIKDRWNTTKLAQRTYLYSGEPIIKKKKK
ncbi:MAG: FAD-dependent oxidoreductase [Spirochaetales bacterium]|nr:FAD-dependent oxidoreductase [Spirochaetales bacterium]